MAIIFQANCEADTEHLGAALAGALPAGTTVALIGTLGAGKTRLVQAVGAALGVPSDEVNSPTFVLINEYEGDKPIYHFDAYRLRDDDEFLELGPEEYFESAGLTFVEWADRVADCLPEEYVRIEIEVLGETERRFMISATSAQLSDVIVNMPS
ncbi:tRNA (adenosine(37)-N6)-threonylcarbamoyltransferase complex ATPase subunit type 1 TsaE [Adhaeretor mobilis]|uniref:tRNA threonylcarbamoyladenosine biosynthesis protein TsaE n=1 Tax=Adhaeretor mobilis TaxID=1930276 RepID=A0A517MUS9_9BACT|nr:tRNA (adenosine(37)-N6)-threonylcarbamoyltransferase complex ATPase subunit type 1 TsaE [Adhaeretor mobilis]QDS98641.1 tRNA threonylcarbamoyladenosine biosynthesis protein TsaE [Adhaeretor mobilis]